MGALKERQGSEDQASVSYALGWGAFCWTQWKFQKLLYFRQLTFLVTERDGCVQLVFYKQ